MRERRVGEKRERDVENMQAINHTQKQTLAHAAVILHTEYFIRRDGRPGSQRLRCKRGQNEGSERSQREF